jgi:hypothetical protein
MVSPLAFAVHAIARRSAWSLLFEVLPVWLLAAQSLVAVSSRGDVDGRSNTPLFSRPIGALRKGMGLRGANDKITHFLGRWTIQERHNIDEFLEALGFNSWQRAVISHAGQSYTLEPGRDGGGDTLRIITQDLRGTSELELPLSGKSVSADDGDNGARVCRSAYVKGSPPAVVITERFPDEREPYSVCRRTIQPDGRMCIDVTKRTAGGRSVAMRAIASRVS